MCNAVPGTAVLGQPVEALELGRIGSSYVVNFEQPSNIDNNQRYQTERILRDSKKEGLAFARTWDAYAVSIISVVPFVLSVIFAGVWIGISIHRYSVDAQVATQTAFTIALFIVTAGNESI